ncbi:thiol-disulfide oxidoreductase ResA [Bacillus sp. FJAT-49736]|uniref:thiol-disulfide oxidoreductase ResA n=1 Tax=Bacillus sp. FJAT-49736 TaxID=2833582 RepID=UPI001BC9B543|nr:thiol-disulfide oxidoreductase ResA [Bacillus sp. FJAT-49736]MBS4173322.1 thiol-disulfide oxidoreductase ResA [Bacillus sp. FJAT-49736]
MSQKKKQRLYIRTAILIVLLAAVGYTLYANLNKDNHEKVSVGDKAPDFLLKDMKGNTHRLSDYKGKGVFLNFWGTYCPPCKSEMPYMDEVYKTYKNKGVEILAVNVGESNFIVNKFVKQYKLSFPILIDKDRDVQSVYGVDALPHSVLIGPDGKVKQVIIGNENLTKKDFVRFMESIKP